MNRAVAAARLDLRTQWRYGIVAVATALTAGWTAVLLAVPAGAAHTLGTFVLFVDTATFGVFFAAALVLFERTEGALSSLIASPLRPAEYLAAKLGTLTALVTVASTPIVVAAARADVAAGGLAYAAAGVALCSLFFLSLSLYLVMPTRTLAGFLTVAPGPMVPFLLVPLVHLTGLVGGPHLFAVPTTGAADLIRMGLESGGVDPPPWGPGAAAGYLAAWTAAVLVAARRRLVRELGPAPSAGRGVARGTGANPYHAGRTVREGYADRRPQRRGSLATVLPALVRLDARLIHRDGLLLIALAGPVLLAAALRLGYPPAADLVTDRFGLDLAPYQPVLLAALVMLHVPLMLGTVGSVLVLDDLDERHVAALSVTPVTVPRYLAYRVAATAVISLMMLAVCVPLSGLAAGHATGPLVVSALVAAAQSALVVLAVAAFAGNKVEGLAMLKLVGSVVTLVPVAAWWVAGAAALPLAAVPATWAAHGLWAQTAAGVATAGATGAALTGVAGLLLARRALGRLGRAG